MLKAVVGSILLLAAVALSYVSYSNGEAMIEKKEALVKKYVKASDEALAQKDIKGAIKYAKMAIETDPKNKLGYTCYSNAIAAQFKPAVTPQSSATPANSPAPAPNDDEDDDSMGC